MIRATAALLAPLLLIAAQAPATLPHARQTEGSTLRPADLRVAAIGYRLAAAGGSLCPKQGPITGLQLHHLAEYERPDRPRLVAAGMDRGPGILAVVAGSPADIAGLRAGDVLLAVDGASFPSPTEIAATTKSSVWRPLVEASETWFFDRLARGPVTLSVRRAGEAQPVTIDLSPATGCLLRIRLAQSDQRTAVANGPYVIVSSGLLSLVKNDDELAFLIAHEMAHVLLGHGALLRGKAVPRSGAARGFGKNGAIVRETEREADLLGGRLMLAAGYDPARGVMVLPRMGAAVTLFGLFQTHDDDADRIKRMQELSAGARPG